MNSGTQEVRYRVNNETKVAGTATFAIYDLVSEATDDLGEAKVLELINAQVRTNEMNRIRALARGGPTKTALRNKAFAMITIEEWQEIAGDVNKIEAMVEAKIAILQKEAQTTAPDDDND